MGSSGKTSRAAPATLPESSAAPERLEVDQFAARAVDDPHAVLHADDRRRVDPVDGLGRLRQMDRDEVRALIELVGRLDAVHAEVAEALGRDELVEGDHLHVERLRAARDQLADPPEADHAERLAVELVAAVARARPLAAGRGRRAPAGRCARARARAPACARPPRRSSTPGRSRPGSRAWSPRPGRRCPRPFRRGRRPSGWKPWRSGRP